MRHILPTLMLAIIMSVQAFSDSGSLSRLRVTGDQFLDAANRSVLLRGVNYGRKNAPWFPDRGEQAYADLGAWGLNCVRLYINWGGLEPEPGAYNADFLAELDQHVAWANAHGLYVMIDFHQDLFSRAIPGGNGAPAWAVLDDDLPHSKPDGPWGLAYFTSEKLHRAMRNFWDNAEGPGGVGLQDRYAAAVQEVARRYADNPGVVGIDLMNEPGLDDAVAALPQVLMAAAPKLATLENPPTDLLTAITSGNGFEKFYELAGREDVYRWMIDAITPLLQEFETTRLQPFYDKVGAAVREVSDAPILFFEPPVLANSGARSALRPLQDAEGKTLVNQAYAPHAYDLVTDTPEVATPSSMRLEIMFARVAEHGASLGLPVVIGEWGALYGNDDARAAARLVVDLFERYRMGDLYWSYEHNLREKTYFDQICRPWPVAVAGRLTEWTSDADTRAFEITWEGHAEAEGATRVYLPRAWYGEQPEVTVQGGGAVTWTTVAGEAGGWWVDVNGGAGVQVLRVAGEG